MCGICGFTGKINRSEEVLKKMADAVRHRGPDEDGYYSDEKINLGIRRLTIIDVKTGQQPTHNEDKSIWAVFNGEIYNFADLRKDLQNKGHKLYTDHSDTEVITHLFEEYGIKFMHKLNGMFAIAIWDKNNEKLILVRDRIGVKPLFYSMLNGNLVFGSEIKAILKYPLYDREINYEAVYHYFTFKNIPSPMTAFKNIYSLSPGEIVTFSNGNISREIWYKVRFQEKEYYDTVFVEKNILAILEDATMVRMVSDVPFGAYLSGGIDSSAIVALMTRFTNKPVKTFSLGYEDELKNKEADLFYARKVANAYGTDHHEYIMSYKELVNDIENVIEAFDQPFSGTISSFFLAKLMKKHVKVALSGDGADELFGSYLSHRTAQPMYHFSRLHEKISANKLTEEEKRLFSPCSGEFLKELFIKSEGREEKWRYNLSLFSDEEKDSLLTENFRKNIGQVKSFDLMKRYFGSVTSKDPLNRILEMEWNTQLPDQVLAFVDFLSMAHSVEIRSPFFDYRLLEFVSTIPGSMKIKDGNVKDILKRTVEPLLPEGVTRRPKEGFVLPIFDWMAEKLKDYSLDLLSESRFKKHNLINVSDVNNLLRSYRNGNSSNAARIWNIMMFQVWWDRYFGSKKYD